MRPAILETGVASAHELDDLTAHVEGAARDEGTVFYQARIHQVHGVRSAFQTPAAGASVTSVAATGRT
jgi:hypothetical protein